jgi:hypothetical protein
MWAGVVLGRKQLSAAPTVLRGPNLALGANKTTANASLTPPKWQRSSWNASIVRSWSSYSKTTRSWTWSPAAAGRIAAPGRSGHGARVRPWEFVRLPVHHASTSDRHMIAAMALVEPTRLVGVERDCGAQAR